MSSVRRVYVEKKPAFAVQAKELYTKWLESGSTFRFEYQFQGRDGEEIDVASSRTDVFPVRGLVAVYVFITGLYGAVVMCGDEERGLFLPLSYGYRIPCRVASMAAPAIMVSISGLLALWAGGVMTSFPREAAAMAGYCCVVIASAWILRLGPAAHQAQAPGSLLHHTLPGYRKPCVLSCFCGCREVLSGTGPGGEAVSSLVLSADVQVI